MFTNFHWDEANLFTRWPDSKVFFANFFQHVKKITQLLEFCKYQGGKIIWVFEKPAYLIHGFRGGFLFKIYFSGFKKDPQ